MNEIKSDSKAEGNFDKLHKVKKIKYGFITLNIFIIIISLGLSQGYIERCGEFKLKPEFVMMFVVGIFGILIANKLEKKAMLKHSKC